MELKALFTRQIASADESIRIQVEGCHTFEDFKAKIAEACMYGDSRASTQMQRLAHDTDLTKNLTESEKEAFLKAAYILYPEVPLPEETLLKKGCKFEFAKINAHGESLTVQVMNIESYDELETTLFNLWQLIDNRLYETNKRELDHMQYIRTLDMNTQIKVGMILDILYGRQFKEEVAKRLEGAREEA